MKTATTALNNLLLTGVFEMADLYTVLLRGGGVIRWTDAEQPIIWGGNTYALGPLISHGEITEQVGPEVDSLEVHIECNDDDLISGVPVIRYIKEKGFYGAKITLQRAFAPDWATMFGAGPTGTILRFYGRMGEVSEAGDIHIDFSVNSWIELLDQQMPPNLAQALCMHTVYDTGCTLAKASFAITGAVVTGVTPTASNFKTNLVAAAGYFDLGMIVFTSGANNGQKRTIKLAATGGVLTMVLGLPAAPALGDTFTVYPGCDTLHTTCITKFSNQAHFKGMPFVPAVETSV